MQEPWGKHQDSLAEKRPFPLTGLKCTAQTSMSDNSYSALVRCSICAQKDSGVSEKCLQIPAPTSITFHCVPIHECGVCCVRHLLGRGLSLMNLLLHA